MKLFLLIFVINSLLCLNGGAADGSLWLFRGCDNPNRCGVAGVSNESDNMLLPMDSIGLPERNSLFGLRPRRHHRRRHWRRRDRRGRDRRGRGRRSDRDRDDDSDDDRKRTRD